jgi:hypothetical protein
VRPARKTDMPFWRVDQINVPRLSVSRRRALLANPLGLWVRDKKVLTVSGVSITLPSRTRLSQGKHGAPGGDSPAYAFLLSYAYVNNSKLASQAWTGYIWHGQQVRLACFRLSCQ